MPFLHIAAAAKWLLTQAGSLAFAFLKQRVVAQMGMQMGSGQKTLTESEARILLHDHLQLICQNCSEPLVSPF